MTPKTVNYLTKAIRTTKDVKAELVERGATIDPIESLNEKIDALCAAVSTILEIVQATNPEIGHAAAEGEVEAPSGDE